jgi:hypothetical protein
MEEDGEVKQNKQKKKKKKPHRGYAFIVYEREKDMKGKLCLLNILHAYKDT